MPSAIGERQMLPVQTKTIRGEDTTRKLMLASQSMGSNLAWKNRSSSGS